METITAQYLREKVRKLVTDVRDDISSLQPVL